MNEPNVELHWLAPREDLSQAKVYQVYEKRLNQIFGKDDPDLVFDDDEKENHMIRNIAVVGDLGSGKSSLLRTYSKKNNLDFMFISLVDLESCKLHKEQTKDDNIPDERTVKTGYTTSVNGNQKKQLPFEEEIKIYRAESDEEKEDRETVQKRLECSILRQLLSYCTREDLRSSALKAIPETPMSRKIDEKLKWSLGYLGCLCIGLLFDDQFGAALRVMGLPVDWCVFLHAVGLCLAFWSIYELGCYLWQEHKLPLRLEKLTLKSSAAEAEITPDSQQHCLDLYNFEMVHILERIAGRHGNTVVFEDLERFESEICVATMTKLWELNKLLNTHLQTLDPDAKPVRFVYAISDKVLNAENRVKYFDVVLPVLPSLNYCNFIPLFRAELNKMGYNDIDDRSNSISPVIEILNGYLTDHRQMLSTLNEFSLLCDLFRANADTEVGNEEAAWLLAFAACKTLYPEYCYRIFSRKMSDELPAAPADSMIQELIENNWLTKTNLQRIVYPWNHICDQWIEELKRGIKQKRHRVVEKLQRQIHDNKGEAKIGRLEDIRNRRDFQQLLLDAPSPYFADEVKKIVGLDGIIEFGYEWILDRINELSGANAFCSCMYLLAQDEERSRMSVDEKEKIGQWCRTQLDAPNFSLSGSWRFQENVDVVKKVAAEILIDPNDNELLEKIATLTLRFPAGASSSK